MNWEFQLEKMLSMHSSGEIIRFGPPPPLLNISEWNEKQDLEKLIFLKEFYIHLEEYRNGIVKNWTLKYFNKIGILIAEGEYSLGMEIGQWFYYYVEAS